MVKMEESQIKGNFLLNSPRLVLHVLNFIGDFLNSTLASLARGAFFTSDFPRKKKYVGIPY